MPGKRKILLHLDTDPQPSVFDRIVAIDSDIDQLFSYGSVKPEQVQSLIHGCIFTRHPKDLSQTAVFIGGSNVADGEKLLSEAKKHLIPKFGLSVSLMLDANGSNTTAVAAVRCAARHMNLSEINAAVLGTGPVGQRIAFLLARQGARVRIISRSFEKAQAMRERILQTLPSAQIDAQASTGPSTLAAGEPPQALLIAAGPPGVQLMPASVLQSRHDIVVMIDLNAVPPHGLEGVEVMDAGANRFEHVAYGAIGVGNLKMKIHKTCIANLFGNNQLVLDLETIYDVAASV
jgi:hypothetical protein